MSTFQLASMDAIEFLGTLPDSSVDLIVTDPPYESLEKHRKVGTTTRLKHSKASSNDWFEIFPNERFPVLMSELYRVLKPERHFYLFCDAETMFVVKPIAEESGFHFWKPLVWDKVAIGMGYHYRARYEFVLFFDKGKSPGRRSFRKLNDLGIPDIITSKRVYRGYPTEKPVDVAKVLVTQSTEVGEIVIDPFMGVGSTGIAAVENQRDFWGNDLNDDAVEEARSRLLASGGVERGHFAQLDLNLD